MIPQSGSLLGRRLLRTRTDVIGVIFDVAGRKRYGGIKRYR
jgi:hypothetical protein